MKRGKQKKNWWKVLRISTVRYNWPMSAHTSQAFSIAHCTISEDLPNWWANKSGNQGIIHIPIGGCSPPKFSGHPKIRPPLGGQALHPQLYTIMACICSQWNMISCGAMHSRNRHPALPPGCSSWGYVGVTGITVTEPTCWNRLRPEPWTGSAAVAQPDMTIVKLTYRHIVFQTFQGWYTSPRTPIKKSEKSRVPNFAMSPTFVRHPHKMLDCLRKVLFRSIWENSLAHLWLLFIIQLLQ